MDASALSAIVPPAAVLAAYSVACLVLFITPGPDMSLWLAKTLSGGRRGGIAAMLGTQLGCVFHTLFAAIGLSALLAASATAFGVLKVIGAVYLAWLASMPSDRAPPSASRRRTSALCRSGRRSSLDSASTSRTRSG